MVINWQNFVGIFKRLVDMAEILCNIRKIVILVQMRNVDS